MSCDNDTHNNIPNSIYEIEINCKCDIELNDDATSLIPYVLSSLESTSTVDGLNPD